MYTFDTRDQRFEFRHRQCKLHIQIHDFFLAHLNSAMLLKHLSHLRKVSTCSAQLSAVLSSSVRLVIILIIYAYKLLLGGLLIPQRTSIVRRIVCQGDIIVMRWFFKACFSGSVIDEMKNPSRLISMSRWSCGFFSQESSSISGN